MAEFEGFRDRIRTFGEAVRGTRLEKRQLQKRATTELVSRPQIIPLPVDVRAEQGRRSRLRDGTRSLRPGPGPLREKGLSLRVFDGRVRRVR